MLAPVGGGTAASPGPARGARRRGNEERGGQQGGDGAEDGPGRAKGRAGMVGTSRDLHMGNIQLGPYCKVNGG